MIPLHHAAGGEKQFSHLAGRDLFAFRISYFALHTKCGFTYGAGMFQYFFRIEVEESSSAPLGDPINIRNSAREGFNEVLHDIKWHRLCANFHIFPIGKVIIGKLDISVLDGIEYGNGNGYHEKDVSAFFFGH